MKTFTTLILIVVACLIVVFLGWSRMPDFLSYQLSKKMKVSVEIDDLMISSKQIKVEKLEIDNPKGSILPRALFAAEIFLKAPLSRYFQSDIVIDEVLLNDVYIGLEFQSSDSSQGNWTTIINNLKQASGKSKRTLLIKKLILTNIEADLVYEKEDGAVKRMPPLPRIEFTNVTSSEGISSDQIARIILELTLRSLFEQLNLKDMLQNPLQLPEKAADGLLHEVEKPLNGL